MGRPSESPVEVQAERHNSGSETQQQRHKESHRPRLHRKVSVGTPLRARKHGEKSKNSQAQSRLDPSHPRVLAAQPGVAGVEPAGRCPQGVPRRTRPRPLVSRKVGDSEDVHRSGLPTPPRTGPRWARVSRPRPEPDRAGRGSPDPAPNRTAFGAGLPTPPRTGPRWARVSRPRPEPDRVRRGSPDPAPSRTAALGAGLPIPPRAGPQFSSAPNGDRPKPPPGNLTLYASKRRDFGADHGEKGES